MQMNLCDSASIFYLRVSVVFGRYYEKERIRNEDKAANTFYRLLTRTSQALDMLGILIEAYDQQRVRVRWDKLPSGMTFSKMVTDATNHDEIKRFLKELVCEEVRFDAWSRTIDS